MTGYRWKDWEEWGELGVKRPDAEEDQARMLTTKYVSANESFEEVMDRVAKTANILADVASADDAAKRLAEDIRAHDQRYPWNKVADPVQGPVPTSIDLEQNPELAMMYEVVLEETGEVVPDVFSVDTKEGVAWQYVKDYNGVTRMEGSRPKMRRVTGSFTLRRIG